ncbi:unnamed protein product [Meganyctiphanes norvegica]|uniref:Uncharacterized protein n=1 Tax=Meganyctiphanes norvegica TaxID=48144 RepID=A0AAV2S087_MEGNR
MPESETAGNAQIVKLDPNLLTIRVRKYVHLKIAQTAICLVLVAIGLSFMWTDLDDDGGYESLAYKKPGKFTLTMLLFAVTTGIATIILHHGNKNANIRTLKTFKYVAFLTYILFFAVLAMVHEKDNNSDAGRLCVGFVIYSLFEKFGGSPTLVKQRIQEIQQGETLVEENVKV